MTSGDASELVRAALPECLERGEIGLQVAVWADGRLVVDEAAGLLAPDGAAPMTTGTPLPVFSVTKAITATALHLQAERGLVDYEAPVARYWPRFAVNGKDRMTVRDVLSHRSGIPQMPEGVTPELMADWDWMVDRIAGYTPAFPPGTKNGYQSLVFGWTVGEIVRRTDPRGRGFAGFVQDEIFTPLAMTDCWMGAPADELHRVPALVGVGATEVRQLGGEGPGELAKRAMPAAVAPSATVHNLPVVRGAVLPGAGAIGPAHSLVRLFALLAGGGELDGVRLLSERRVRACLAPRENPDELDTVFGGGNRIAPPIGRGGYWTAHDLFGGGPVLCHPGAGASIGWANVDTGLALVVTHNRMFGFDPRLHEVRDHPFFPILAALSTAYPESFASASGS
ncbi:serine hydrolase domain-containing protein [Pseudofrankia inefficax]|uniref:Beta-lactamase n=1 Tax=Pseudofrankia inefficax (strain DSM 45817 / CECT 9037 / DDB 130130 / EuI1c) TaxID=298654 RepID=E3IU44_PSEI1|nr:serine hydrolase domain-containing protein [Pseudofrankia inefficax]ADP81237.1 beta-lactamase [Pseudofrankia inefficax]